MKMTERRTVTMPKLDPRLLVACGSVNSITLRQLDVAEQNGFSRLRLTPRQKLDPGYWESENGKEALQGINEMLAANPRCIIETNDEGGNQPTADYAAARGLDLEGLRVGIASSIGHMLGKLFTSPALGTLLLTGGDTLLQCMNCVGIKELEPVCRDGKGRRAGPLHLPRLHPLRYHQVGRLRPRKTAARPCRPHCSQIKLRQTMVSEKTMACQKLPGLTWEGTIYENEEMGTPEALLPTAAQTR